MTNNPIIIFEELKKINEYQAEYWSARQLAKILDYSDYRNFETVMKKAMESCKNSNQTIRDHFVDIADMIEVGKTASSCTPRGFMGWKLRIGN